MYNAFLGRSVKSAVSGRKRFFGGRRVVVYSGERLFNDRTHPALHGAVLGPTFYVLT
jgi:hypothetical protein